ncbi:MAG: methylenetetrahydrofolate reductase [Actinomycetota bacterium]
MDREEEGELPGLERLMALRRSRIAKLSEVERVALRRLIEDPKFELIPLSDVGEQAAFLPPGVTVTVTASPAKGIEATIELAEKMAAVGHPAIPHLSARMIRDRAHLAELLQRLAVAGLTSVFVVGGDPIDADGFPDGLALLRAIEETGPRPSEIGIPGYPEGHVDIDAVVLGTALRDKSVHADYIATQLCLDPTAIASWVQWLRASGIALPVHLGTPGVADLTKLLSIATKIGVGGSARYLSKNRRAVGRLVRKGGYRPDGLLEDLAPVLADANADVRALHLFTFNQVERTVDWQRRMLEELSIQAR